MRRVVCFLAATLALAGCPKDEKPGTGVSGIGGGSGTGVAGIAAGGSGTSGAAGMAAGTGSKCGTPTVTGAAAHAQALEVLNGMSPCGFGSCHSGSGKAKLVLLGKTDLKMALVNQPSCEAPAIPLVDGRGGDVALSNSWLWLKLVSPAANMTDLTPQQGWPATPGTCGQMSGFGVRMPQGNTMPFDLSDADRAAKIRNWICAGAPGPNG